MASSTCEPSNIFGAWEHTLFLGLTVRSFTSSLGLQNETTSIQVELVYDPCDSVDGKRYYDEWLRPQLWYGPDPKDIYFPPSIGCPVYFRFGTFEFAGILQHWEQQGSIDGSPLFYVTITGPREILDGVQLITKHYAGGIGSAYNVLNCYGLLENINAGSVCCAGYDPFWSTINGFPTPAFVSSTFGGADASDNGMTWKSIKRAIHLLTCRNLPQLSTIVDPLSHFCYSGRVVFRGDNRVGFGYLPRDTRFDYLGATYASYCIDLSEVPDGPYFTIGENAFNIRLGDGGAMSLGDALNEISSRIGFDYYVDMLPSFMFGVLTNVIRVRGISKKEQYDTNAIAAFVASQPGKITYNYGRELRNEPTSAIIIGDKRRDVIEQTGNNVMPYWGTDLAGDVIFGSTFDLDDDHEVTIDISDLGIVDLLLSPITSYTFTVGELRAALVNMDLWMSYIGNSDNPIKTQLGINATWGNLPLFALQEFNDNPNPNLTLHNFQSVRKIDSNINTVTLLYNYIRKYAEEYYGRKFIIPVPQTCTRYNTDDISYETSHQPSPEGGWPIVVNPLSLSSVGLFYFRNPEGLVQPFIYFGSVKAGGIDYSTLDQNDYVTDGSNIYLPCEIEPDYVYLDYGNRCQPYIVVSIGNPVLERLTNNDAVIFDGLLQVIIQQLQNGGANFAALAADPAGVRSRFTNIMNNSNGRFFSSIPMGNVRYKPDGALAAIRNNILTYGPWSSHDVPSCIVVGTTSIVPGQTIVEKDESLVPWTFNGEGVLNCFGIMKARDLIAKAQSTEMGSIRMAGLPILPLGHEMMASAPQLAQYRNMTAYTDGSINYSLLDLLDENGNNQYGVALINWVGLYGPNISSINVALSDSEVTTEYVFRTYTKQVNGNNSKATIERFRKMSSTRLQLAQNISSFVNDRLRQRTANHLAVERGLGGDPGGLFNVADIHADNRSKIGRSIAAKNADFHNILAGGSDRFFDAPSGIPASGGTTFRVDADSWVLHSSAFVNPQTAVLDLDTVSTSGYRAFAETNTLFRPVLMPGTSGDFSKMTGQMPLSQFEPPQSSGGSGNSVNFLRPPAFSSTTVTGVLGTLSGIAADVTSTKLNPFFHPGFSLDPSGHGKFGGHDMDFVLRYGNEDLMEEFAHNLVTAESGYYDAVRYGAFALRGPMILTGWGFDTEGYPVPNAVSGDNPTNKSPYFLQNFGRKPHKWKTGPIDLRWDYGRGVWTAGGTAYPPVLGRLNQHIGADVETIANTYASGNSATLIEYDGTPLSGNNIVPISNILGHPIGSGSRVWLDYDPNNKTYVIANAEYKPVCAVTNVDCYADEDNVSHLEVCFRTLYLNAGFSTEQCYFDDPAASGDVNASGECGGDTFDFPSTGAGGGGSPSLPDPAEYFNGIGYNVKSFGALGIGTDDTEALQEAYDFVGALASGGTVYYPEGVYGTTRQSALGAFNYNLIVEGNNIRSYGAGRNTVITNLGGSAGTMFRTSTTTPQTNISFENMTIDGNWSNINWGWDNYTESSGVITNSGSAVAGVVDQHGIALYGVKNGMVKNVWLKNIGMNAVHIAQSFDVDVMGNTIENVGKNGVYGLVSAGLNIDDNTISFCNDSPDSGSSKDYFLDVSGGWAAVYIDAGPSGVDTAYNSVRITDNRIKTYTSNGIVVKNTATTIDVSTNVIESKILLSSAFGGRPLIKFYFTGEPASEPVICTENILHNLDHRGLGYGIDVYDLDDLNFSDNKYYGLAPTRFVGCDIAQVKGNTWQGTSGTYAVLFAGTSSNYIRDSEFSHNIIIGHAGNIGIYCNYVRDSIISTNISRNMADSSGVWLEFVYNSSIIHNHNLSGCGFAVDPTNTVSGNIIAHNMAASHYVTSGQLTYNYADHNVPGAYNSSDNLSLGLEVSGVTFGSSLGGLSQSTSNFYWNSESNFLFANYLKSSGIDVTGGDIEIKTVGMGDIHVSPNGTRWKLTVSDFGVVQTVEL